MLPLAGKSVVVIGGSQGVGRAVVAAAIGAGASVLAVARDAQALDMLAHDVADVETLTLDACDEAAPRRTFDARLPDILVITAGALPAMAPLHEQSWSDFSINWEADTKLAFLFCSEALRRPLPPGARVIVVSSGAALAGSPNSGGYAGAKRTQVFIANYAQKESDRLGLGLRFVALAPRIIPDTVFGGRAVEGYARYLGVSPDDFVAGMVSPPTAHHVVDGIIELATQADRSTADLFIVSGKGLEPVRA